MKPTTVLLVDDDEDIRFIAEMALADVGGLEVRVAASGAEGLAMLREGFRPSVVLLDQMMEGLTGEQVLAEIRNDETLTGLVIVFMTAEVDPGLKAKLRKAGAAEIIQKPFDPMTLAAQIEKILKDATLS